LVASAIGSVAAQAANGGDRPERTGSAWSGWKIAIVALKVPHFSCPEAPAARS
jgi:hypothetical protein